MNLYFWTGAGADVWRCTKDRKEEGESE